MLKRLWSDRYISIYYHYDICIIITKFCKDKIIVNVRKEFTGRKKQFTKEFAKVLAVTTVCVVLAQVVPGCRKAMDLICTVILFICKNQS